MRVLLDACVHEALRRDFPGHHVETARYAELKALEYKQLLDAAERLFDIIISCDQSLSAQQNFSGRTLALIVLIAPTNRIEDLRPLVPAAMRTLESIAAGEIVELFLDA